MQPRTLGGNVPPTQSRIVRRFGPSANPNVAKIQVGMREYNGHIVRQATQFHECLSGIDVVDCCRWMGKPCKSIIEFSNRFKRPSRIVFSIMKHDIPKSLAT
ncbi:hypothetical protein KC320_g68 [Hortaea werneckii]|nr:hypothetical protein KC320_g68 [Hortaea werneckii]